MVFGNGALEKSGVSPLGHQQTEGNASWESECELGGVLADMLLCVHEKKKPHGIQQNLEQDMDSQQCVRRTWIPNSV